MNIFEFEQIIFNETTIKSNEVDLVTVQNHFNDKVLSKKMNTLSKIPIDKIIATLEKVGATLSNPNGVYYKVLMEKLPKLLNYSDEMVDLGLKFFPEMVSSKNLKAKLASLGDYRSLDYFVQSDGGQSVRSVPVGTVCHIAAGNIFLGAVDSLIHGIITKNINILKVSKQDLLFPTVFYKVLKEVDIDNVILPYLSIVYWSKDCKEIDAFIKQNVDSILLFGGEEAAKSYKMGLSPKTNLLSFGPKISFGIVCKDSSLEMLKESAAGFARDIILWEQRACTSCQNIFLEKSNLNNEFIEMLNDALEQEAMNFKQSNIDIDAEVEIRRARELAIWDSYNKKGECYEGVNSNHTIIVQSDFNVHDSPLNRTVYVNIVDSYKDIIGGNLSFMKYYMSTVAISSKMKQEIIENLIDLGVLRFCIPGTMATGSEACASHDGLYIINSLVKFINKEDIPNSSLGIEYLEDEYKKRILLEKLNAVVCNAIDAPFYKELYRDIKLPLKSIDEFKKLPTISSSTMRKFSLDKSDNMLVSKDEAKYIFSAGGTTGSMKYVAYTPNEFIESTKYFGDGFESAGVGSGDVVANIMMAGSFWTAYPATNIGLEKTGCTILPITANQTVKETVEYLSMFNANTIIGITGEIIQVARFVEENEIELNIDKVLYSGEHMSDSTVKYIKDTLNAKIIKSAGYAAVESGPIGYQCPSCIGTEHHIFEDWCFTEKGDDGQLIVTCLDKWLHPIIRYEIGDQVELCNDKCDCGRTSTRIKLLSRTSDYIKFCKNEIYYSEVNKALAEISELSEVYQITVTPVGHSVDVLLTIEARNSNIDCFSSDLLNNVHNSFLKSSEALGQFSDDNLINKIEVTIVKPMTIERVGRTGKVKKLIDKRV